MYIRNYFPRPPTSLEIPMKLDNFVLENPATPRKFLSLLRGEIKFGDTEKW